jgi:hypothetical protein
MHERLDRPSQRFTVVCQRILDTGWDFREHLSRDQAFPCKFFQPISQAFRANALQFRQDFVVSQSFVVADNGDDWQCPFFTDGVHDAFEGTQTHITLLFWVTAVVGFVVHSYSLSPQPLYYFKLYSLNTLLLVVILRFIVGGELHMCRECVNEKEQEMKAEQEKQNA